MKMYFYKSPIGILEIICDKDVLISLKLVNNVCNPDKDNNFSKNIKFQLSEYFSGKRQYFDININPTGTVFQKKVWTELLKISYGKTKSYSDIAKSIGNIKAQRAVGSACNKNPIMIIIPCHRVISKSGEPGGFAYGSSIKAKLLELEK